MERMHQPFYWRLLDMVMTSPWRVSHSMARSRLHQPRPACCARAVSTATAGLWKVPPLPREIVEPRRRLLPASLTALVPQSAQPASRDRTPSHNPTRHPLGPRWSVPAGLHGGRTTGPVRTPRPARRSSTPPVAAGAPPDSRRAIPPGARRGRHTATSRSSGRSSHDCGSGPRAPHGLAHR